MRNPRTWAIVALIVGFLFWNPVTRKIIVFLLPLGRGVDDLIEAAAIALAVIFFFGPPVTRKAGNVVHTIRRFFGRFIPILLVGIVLVTATRGCYFNEVVNPNQMAVRTESGKIVEIAGPGMYSGSLWTDIVMIDTSY